MPPKVDGKGAQRDVESWSVKTKKAAASPNTILKAVAISRLGIRYFEKNLIREAARRTAGEAALAPNAIVADPDIGSAFDCETSLVASDQVVDSSFFSASSPPTVPPETSTQSISPTVILEVTESCRETT
ncbi:hypothetical protein BGAL_0356g00010 [Botrytis galanthina]|uniref:Uncharacterized protein n=1 Tax=Botrytis galanthina TaxID=278940 RepID=A0A4V4HTU1_9HELO|nr:hypothetical protein BGAL_0356g00010 [Botrytis galanthina]